MKLLSFLLSASIVIVGANFALGNEVPSEISKAKTDWQARLSSESIADEDARKVHYLLAMILNLNAISEDSSQRVQRLQIPPPKEQGAEAIKLWIKSNEEHLAAYIPAMEAYLAAMLKERMKQAAPATETQP